MLLFVFFSLALYLHVILKPYRALLLLFDCSVDPSSFIYFYSLPFSLASASHQQTLAATYVERSHRGRGRRQTKKKNLRAQEDGEEPSGRLGENYFGDKTLFLYLHRKREKEGKNTLFRLRSYSHLFNCSPRCRGSCFAKIKIKDNNYNNNNSNC
jgi:hypothetical protein